PLQYVCIHTTHMMEQVPRRYCNVTQPAAGYAMLRTHCYSACGSNDETTTPLKFGMVFFYETKE
ncbi:MAG: hypothetical protein ACK559_37915, partial [bacterium]